jgi:hypothetical protein
VRNQGSSANEVEFFNSLLGILKLFSDFNDKAAVPNWLLRDFYAPFVIPELRSDDIQWAEIDEFFGVARRLAYLNRDTALIDSPVTIGLAPLLSKMSDAGGLSREALAHTREIIAAFEHTVYERFYHAPAARKATAIVSAWVYDFLDSTHASAQKIEEWLFKNDLADIIDLPKMSKTIREAHTVGSISSRSFFLLMPQTVSSIEQNILKAIKAATDPDCRVTAGVNVYEPAESKHTLEPDHAYLDAFVNGKPTSPQAGRFLAWAADQFDEMRDDADERLGWLIKPDTNSIYAELLLRIIQLAWEDARIDLRPWPLSRFGKFKGQLQSDIGIWHSSADLSDGLTRHIVRKPKVRPKGLRAVQDELAGLSQLRVTLRRNLARYRTRPRRRLFLLTSSVRIFKGTVLREFDGGILQISARTGRATLYLLETKGRSTPEKAANTLRMKLQDLGVVGHVHRLKSRSAYVEVKL